MKKKVLISGGTGFLGSTFIKKYSSLYEFLVISRQDIPNVVHPKNLTLELLQEFRPEYFMHLAAHSTMGADYKTVKETIRTNIEFPTLVTELFFQAGGKKILNVGSYWEHMNNAEYSPNSIYAASKKSFEDLLQYYVDIKGVSAVTLKLFDTYGKNDPRRKILRIIYDSHKNQLPLDISGGDQIISLVHAEDVAEAFEVGLKAISKGHQSYLVKAKQVVKLKEIINEFCRINNLSPKLNWGARPYSSQDFFTEVTVNPLLPGWSPKIALTDGLKDLFQH